MLFSSQILFANFDDVGKGIWSIFIFIHFLQGNVENNSVRYMGDVLLSGDFFFVDNFWELKSVEIMMDIMIEIERGSFLLRIE